MELLEKNLRNRFPAVGVISAFHIFDPRRLPSDECELYQYGGPELDFLLEQYTSSPLELDSGDTCEEWSEFKASLTVPRNRLKTNTLDQLMLISIEGPSAHKSDFGRAADNWGGLHNNRIRWQD